MNLAQKEARVTPVEDRSLARTARTQAHRDNRTGFFQDQAYVERLERVIIPRLFKGKGAGGDVRCWIVGCTVRLEAYGLAMLLLEEAWRRGVSPRLQVFVTDSEDVSLHRERGPVFPASIRAEVSPERLDRFFESQEDNHRARQFLGELVVFARHSLFSDPPFSHLDLISCRHQPGSWREEDQREALAIFHYALNPEGHLLAGSDVGVADSALFTPDSRGSGLYHPRHRPEGQAPVPLPFRDTAQAGFQAGSSPPALRPGSLREKMVERLSPSILVDFKDEIRHCSDQAGRYIRFPGGAPTRDLFEMVLDPLRPELRATVDAARERGAAVRSAAVPLGQGDELRPVVIRVHPVEDAKAEGLLVVIFEEIEPALPETNEIEQTRSPLSAAPDQAAERSGTRSESNQEANQELWLVLDELQMRREELQSINEELTSLSSENRQRLEERKQLSMDVENIVAAANIPILFLDRKLQILRFTPQVAGLFNLRMIDRGRPLSDLRHRLGKSELESDSRRVLEELQPVERELTGDDGRYFLTRFLPYRAANEEVNGVVISFVDITERKRSEEVIRQMGRRLVAAENRERKRLASIIHDELQQLLVAIGFQFSALKQVDDPRLWSLAEEGDRLLKKALASSRHLTTQLRPPVLYEDGLLPALRWLASQMPLWHGLAVEVDSEVRDLPLADEIRMLLFEAVRELLFNVVKHAEVKKARVEVRLEETQVRLTIRDAGVGFDVKAAGQNQEAGLGLASVRERLEMCGGTATIESQTGQGTEVTLRVPARWEESKITSVVSGLSAPPVDKSELIRGDGVVRVLVADDHAVVREGIVRMLTEDQRLQVIGQAVDGLDAIRMAEESQPDVLLMDINMPRMNGIEATRRLSECCPQVSVVGLSVQDDEATIQSVLAAGAEGFVSKSDSAEQLVAAILEAARRGASKGNNP